MPAMIPRERLDYSAIVDRPPLNKPDGAHVIIWPVLALEDWDISRPMPRMVLPPPMGEPQLPDVPNWSWHEYGMRVGFWRVRRLFEELGINPTATINARVCETYPRVIEACMELGWEMNAHSYGQVPMHKLDDQRAIIHKSVEIITQFCGAAPRGWFGPGLTQTYDTLDYLAEAGIEYIGDMVLDDEPVVLKTSTRPVVALPYNFEVHDIAMMMIQHHVSENYKARLLDSFNWLYNEDTDRPKVLAFALHPYLAGVPHRIGHIKEALEQIVGKPGVTVMNGAQILDWYLEQRPLAG